MHSRHRHRWQRGLSDGENTEHDCGEGPRVQMASSKLSTGKEVLKGWMVSLLALARTPFAARAWTCSAMK